MNLTRTALAFVVAAIVFAAVAGAASTLGLTSSGLGSGQADVASCGSTTGVARSYTVSSGSVASVTLSGFPASCAGGVAKAEVVNSSGTVVGSGGPATIAGDGTVTISFSPQPAATAVARTHVVVEGP